jgi:AraC-like DNA-binding protein/mannose-6-phosphate isomerase-like protein (cupin superfamily)
MASGTICEPVVVEPGRLVRIERVEQAADTLAPERFAHFHDVVELVWFEAGEGELITEDGTYPIGAGTAVLLPPMRHHDFVLGTAARVWVLAHIDPALLGSDTLPTVDRCLVARFDAAERQRLAMLMDWLLVVDDNDDASLPMTLPILNLLIIAVLRAAATPASESGVGFEALSRLRPALDRVASNPAATLTLDDAAAACHLSPAYFSRRFKSVLGINYTDYVRMYRLRLAARRLLTSNDRIGAIAYEAGFATAAHFTAQFHNRYGMSPRQYRAGNAAEA